MDDTLQQVLNRATQLEEQLATQLPVEEFTTLSKEYSDISPVAAQIKSYYAAKQTLKEAEELLADPDIDADMQELAEAEKAEAAENIDTLYNAIRVLLLPKDADDNRNVIMEFRAGTGGDEAALFAADLFRMYARYAENRGWKFDVLTESESGVGGYKEASASISGKDVFSRLKFESGVHRVQRVPQTETQGRVHTSAATVAVLPEVEEVDIAIDEKDLRIDVFRASGPGGQSVNTTDSAVRITHIPTGIVVSQQDEKSQHKNRQKGMKVLRARLYEQRRAEADAKRSADRKGQVGSGDRSERIRTYNFPQGRLTEHRINLTLYKLDRVMAGEIDEIIDALTAEDQAQKLAALDGSEA